MKTSTKTKTARIVIDELPSAGTSNPLNLNSAAAVAVRGGMALNYVIIEDLILFKFYKYRRLVNDYTIDDVRSPSVASPCTSHELWN